MNCYNHQETKQTKQQPTTAYVTTTIIILTNSYNNDKLMNMLYITTWLCRLVFELLKNTKITIKHQRRQQQPFPTTEGYNNLVIWSSWVRLKSWKRKLKKTITRFIFTVRTVHMIYLLLLYPQIKWIEYNHNAIQRKYFLICSFVYWLV